MTNPNNTDCIEMIPKKTWEKPEIAELKTSLTEAKGGIKTIVTSEGAFSSPS